MNTAEIRAVADALRAYIAANPRSSDSLYGIRRWWLGAIGMEVSTQLAAAALEQLIDEGVMARRTLPDGRLLYAATLSPPE
jgi:hypothetical protein